MSRPYSCLMSPYPIASTYRRLLKPGHNPKDAPNKMSYWKILKTVKQKEGVKGLYKGKHGTTLLSLHK